MKRIKLTQGKHALVDDEDYEELSKYKWHAVNTGNHLYARNSNGVYMHREVMNTPKGKYTDHINHDGLDNRKSNLRVCTNQQNCWNKSLQSNNTTGHQGVYFDGRPKRQKRWYVRFKLNGKKLSLGYFKNIEEAIKKQEDFVNNLCKDFSPF